MRSVSHTVGLSPYNYHNCNTDILIVLKIMDLKSNYYIRYAKKMLFYLSRNDKQYIYFNMKIEYTLCFHKLSRSLIVLFKVQQIKLYFHVLYIYIP